MIFDYFLFVKLKNPIRNTPREKNVSMVSNVTLTKVVKI